MSAQAARARYLADRVSTASPAALIVLVYDRLSLDLESATAAYREGRPADASIALSHAQRIVTELLNSLDTSSWVGGDDLAALYRYLMATFVAARSSADESLLPTAVAIVTSLQNAWRQAALELTDRSQPALSSLAGRVA
jgi:flagellar protein FliS